MAERRGVRYTVTAVAALAVATLVVLLARSFLAVEGSGPRSHPRPAEDRGATTAVADTLGPAAPVRVEVLNGSGRPGLARDATHRLRDDRFDVVFFGNAPRFDHERSHILDRSGDTTAARAVATALGIDSIATDLDPRLLLDVSVVLGRDWPPPAPEPEGWLQRLRNRIPGRPSGS